MTAPPLQAQPQSLYIPSHITLILDYQVGAEVNTEKRNKMSYVTEIDQERIEPDSNLFQSAFWAHFKENRGLDTQAFYIDYQGLRASMVLVHRPCTVDSGFGYVPYGPDIALPEDRQGRFLEFVSENIRPSLPRNCRFLRYDLPWENPYASDADEGDWSGPPEPRIRELRMNFGSRKWNLWKAPTDMQPPDTVVLNLDKPAARILQEMHPKTRYCIRTAFRRGVCVERRGSAALPNWHRLYLAMAARKEIVAEELDYFNTLFAVGRSHEPDVHLYLAFRHGDLLAGSIIAFQADTAYYLYSTSSMTGRHFMASYSVLWKAILEAKVKGCRRFDLFGIPPNNNPEHPMHGLYRFKTRFGGKIRHFRGCWDYPLDEERYNFLAHVAGNRNPYYHR
jgi:lipid II:glycine glycyltransferase (peptidoglycan interpeptide bridge formation enzyme)